MGVEAAISSGKLLLEAENIPRDILLFAQFLGAFERLLKVIISFPHVCPSVRIQQHISHWMDFHDI
jgi:hypothetical protein